MTTQVYLIFVMTALHHYIKDYATEKIDNFEERINEEIILISTFDNVSLGISLISSVSMNKKRDIIINKM